MDDDLPLPAPRLEPELEQSALPLLPEDYPPLDTPPVTYVNPNAVVAPAPTPAEALQATVTAAVADTLHKIDVRSYLELLARTDPKTFRAWVQMALPQASRGGPAQANIINVHSALPRSPLDGLPPGFDVHR